MEPGCGIIGTLWGHDLEAEGTVATIVTTLDATWMLLAAGWTRQSKRDGRPVRKATRRDQTTTVSTIDHHLTNTLRSQDLPLVSTRAQSVTHTTLDRPDPLHARRRNQYLDPSIGQSQLPYDQAKSPSTLHTIRHHRQGRRSPQSCRLSQWTERSATLSGQPPTSRTALQSGQFSCLPRCAMSSSVPRHRIPRRDSRCAASCAGHLSTMRCSSAVL